MNIRKMISAALKALIAPSGRQSSVHSANEIVRPRIWLSSSTAAICAPAPTSDAIADKRIAVGNRSANATRMLGVMVTAMVVKIGIISAARPEVDGIMKALASMTPVSA